MPPLVLPTRRFPGFECRQLTSLTDAAELFTCTKKNSHFILFFLLFAHYSYAKVRQCTCGTFVPQLQSYTKTFVAKWKSCTAASSATLDLTQRNKRQNKSNFQQETICVLTVTLPHEQQQLQFTASKASTQLRLLHRVRSAAEASPQQDSTLPPYRSSSSVEIHAAAAAADATCEHQQHSCQWSNDRFLRCTPGYRRDTDAFFQEQRRRKNSRDC